MSDLSNYRITDEDIAQNGVVAAPDKLTGTAAQNKAVFDRLIREAVREKYNALLTVLEASLLWEPYDETKAYVPENKVVYNGSSYLCTAACTGVLPTDTAYWRLVAARGADGTGAGDMRAEFYDPRGVETDVFAYVDERTDTYSKAQTLTAATAALIDPSTPPDTPDEAFAKIASALAEALAVLPQKARVATGYYNGTGAYGEQNPTTITLPFEPKVLFIVSLAGQSLSGGVFGQVGVWISPMAVVGYALWGGSISGQAGYRSTIISSNETFSFYNTKAANYQLNDNNYTYVYFAIG